MIPEVIELISFIIGLIISLKIGHIYYKEMRKHLSRRWTLITSVLWFLPIVSFANALSKVPRFLYVQQYGDAALTVLFIAGCGIVYLIWSAILLFHHSKFAWLLWGPMLANPMAVLLIFWYYPVMLVYRAMDFTWESVGAQLGVRKLEKEREERLKKFQDNHDAADDDSQVGKLYRD